MIFNLIKTKNFNKTAAVGLLAGLVGRSDPSPVSSPTQPPLVTTTTVEPVPGPWNSIRLPLDLTPTLYRVDLKPELVADSQGKFWFSGESEVEFVAEEETGWVYIHSYLLEFESVELYDEEVY